VHVPGCGRGLQPDDGIPVPKKLAAELTGARNLQADLFLRPNDDGLFPGFTQTWCAEG